MASIRTRRMLKERVALEKEATDYACFFNEQDMFKFFVYLVAPPDSLYNYKLVKLHFVIPHNYPMVPPEVQFIQKHGTRLHPNLYVDGKVCLSIINTWEGEPWALSMTTDGVLRTIQSLLDNHPYLHEPGQQDLPEYNTFVRYQSWRWWLLDHLQHETHPPAKAWLQDYLVKNADKMIAELSRQQNSPQPLPKRASATWPYGATLPYGAARFEPDYNKLLQDLQEAVKACKAAQPPADSMSDTMVAAPAPSESRLGGSTTPGAEGPKCAAASVTMQDDLSHGSPFTSGSQQKRKRSTATEDGAYVLQATAQSRGLAVQQAKGTAAQQSEPPLKHTKKDLVR